VGSKLAQYGSGLAGAVGGGVGEGANQLTGISPQSWENLALSVAIPAALETGAAGWNATQSARAASHKALDNVLGIDYARRARAATPPPPPVGSDDLFTQARRDSLFKEKQVDTITTDVPQPPVASPIMDEFGKPFITQPPPLQEVTEQITYPISIQGSQQVMKNIEQWIAENAGAHPVNNEKLNTLRTLLGGADTMNPQQIDTTLKTLSGLQSDDAYPEMKNMVGELKDALWSDLMQSPLAPHLGEAYQAWQREQATDALHNLVTEKVTALGKHDILQNPDTLSTALERWQDPKFSKQNQHFMNPSRHTGQPPVHRDEVRQMINQVRELGQEKLPFKSKLGTLAEYGAASGIGFMTGSALGGGVPLMEPDSGELPGVGNSLGGAAGVAAAVMALGAHQRADVGRMMGTTAKAAARREDLLQRLRGQVLPKSRGGTSSLEQAITQFLFGGQEEEKPPVVGLGG
jgi:hypothetical protein